MNAETELAQYKEILQTLWENDIPICYSHGGFHIDCGGVFDGGSDYMELVFEDLPALRQACKDAPHFGPQLFCCRKANCRPYHGLINTIIKWDSDEVLGKVKAQPHFESLPIC